MSAERITSLQNPRVKELVKLRDQRHRQERGVTIIEEPRVIRRARLAGYPFCEVWHCPELLAATDPGLLEFLRAGPAFEAIEPKERREGPYPSGSGGEEPNEGGIWA